MPSTLHLILLKKFPSHYLSYAEMAIDNLRTIH